MWKYLAPNDLYSQSTKVVGTNHYNKLVLILGLQKISKEITDWRKANNWKTVGKNEKSVHFLIPE